MKKVTVIGAGTMGHSLAMVFALGGYQVALNDLSPEILEKSRSLIKANLDTLAEAKLFDPAQREEVAEKRITYTNDLGQAVAGTGFVVEAVVENVEVKKKLFSELDRLAPPEAILASNTSYLDIFKFVETSRPDKVLITHWFAPPHIVPLVEIVVGPQTSEQTVQTVKRLHDELGKTTIVIRKFLPGFVGNRMQAALGLEVFRLLEGGYASPEDLDKAAKAGFGLRLPILGVVKRMDFTGLDLVQHVLKNKSYQPPEVPGRSQIVDDLVAQGRRGVKDGAGFYDYGGRSSEEIMHERDLKLLKLRKFLEELGELG
ncbi:MAG: 3-hydroxyacyl-CoA dehydrogenase family protein [Desulfarculus sp.]|jgi:3-hydroxybutyryl-CoA dehydrogenase|nr:MAG: 3-hydroxyacyl-CoA dehydrogenase family protein [Desulfarculus sp.]